MLDLSIHHLIWKGSVALAIHICTTLVSIITWLFLQLQQYTKNSSTRENISLICGTVQHLLSWYWIIVTSFKPKVKESMNWWCHTVNQFYLPCSHDYDSCIRIILCAGCILHVSIHTDISWLVITKLWYWVLLNHLSVLSSLVLHTPN